MRLEALVIDGKPRRTTELLDEPSVVQQPWPVEDHGDDLTVLHQRGVPRLGRGWKRSRDPGRVHPPALEGEQELERGIAERRGHQSTQLSGPDRVGQVDHQPGEPVPDSSCREPLPGDPERDGDQGEPLGESQRLVDAIEAIPTTAEIVHLLHDNDREERQPRDEHRHDGPPGGRARAPGAPCRDGCDQRERSDPDAEAPPLQPSGSVRRVGERDEVGRAGAASGLTRLARGRCGDARHHSQAQVAGRDPDPSRHGAGAAGSVNENSVAYECGSRVRRRPFRA